MSFSHRVLSAEELARIRGSTDGRTTYITWSGDCYSKVPGQRSLKLFAIAGVNACRCIQLSDGSWVATTRELNYYLDPVSGEILHRWLNPLNEKEVPVMHVANERVQFPLAHSTEVAVSGNTATLTIDVPLCYPNCLWNTELQAYSPFELYQAFEGFKFFFKADELESPNAAVSEVNVAWTRISPWLPWMDMGEHPGELIFSASGSKLFEFECLPELIRRQISEKIPLYKHAPEYDASARNVTSWAYFQRNFAAYRQGGEFPLSQEL